MLATVFGRTIGINQYYLPGSEQPEALRSIRLMAGKSRNKRQSHHEKTSAPPEQETIQHAQAPTAHTALRSRVVLERYPAAWSSCCSINTVEWQADYSVNVWEQRCAME